MRRICFQYVLSALTYSAVVALASPVVAQWMPDSTTNTPVCTLAGSQHTNPAICSDGADGAIIVWQDTRNNGAMNVYAQRLDAAGKTVWTANGVRLATLATNAIQQDPIVAPDGSGGAYVVWQDMRNAKNGIDLYGQHILSNGSLAGPSSGFVVCAAAGDQTNAVICADGNGGAYVAWTDNRPAAKGAVPDIYMNHLSSGGAFLGSAGTIADTGLGTQRNPAICNDGSGGCYIAWEDGSTLPVSIRANHFSSGGGQYWGVHGFLIYQTKCGTCYSANASHVAVRLDGKQLMLAWEVTSINGNGQDIMAARIRCNNAYDTTQVWGQAVDVTGEMPFDQTWPQIFSDDSATSQGPDFRGILVPFEYAWPGSGDNWVVTMIRVLGDGTAQLPGNGAVYTIVNQPHGHIPFQAVPLGSSILTAWNDARFGSNPDTCIYAQIIDKAGNRSFPVYGTRSSWGTPICHRMTTSRDVALAPRTNGAIMAWTDYRAGSTQANIYAQLLLADGSRALDKTPPDAIITAQTGSFDGSLCNVRCTDFLAVDEGPYATGIDSIIPLSQSNMKFTIAKFAPGADTVACSICVLDSFQEGSAQLEVMDLDGNRNTLSYSYCPLPDTSAPLITWDSTVGWLRLHLRDNRPWDRGLQAITVTDSSNVSFNPPFNRLIVPSPGFDAIVQPIDPAKPSNFCISASDTAGNISQAICFSRVLAGVMENIPPVISLSVAHGEVPGALVLRLSGAPSADVTVYDLLGRPVDRFRMDDRYEWNPPSLPEGAYMFEAITGPSHIFRLVTR